MTSTLKPKFTLNIKSKEIVTSNELLSQILHLTISLHTCSVFFQIVNGECRIYYSWPSKKMKVVFGIIIILIEFFIPFFILIFCYGKIVWMFSRRINTSMGDVKAQDSSRDACTDVKNKKKLEDAHKDKFQLARRNTIKTLLIVGLCFIICWSQCEFFYFIHHFGYPLDWNGKYYNFTVLMAFLNSTVNSFIYLMKYKDYQVALRQFLRCKKDDENENQSQNCISTVSSQTNVTHIWNRSKHKFLWKCNQVFYPKIEWPILVSFYPFYWRLAISLKYLTVLLNQKTQVCVTYSCGISKKYQLFHCSISLVGLDLPILGKRDKKRWKWKKLN